MNAWERFPIRFPTFLEMFEVRHMLGPWAPYLLQKYIRTHKKIANPLKHIIRVHLKISNLEIAENVCTTHFTFFNLKL